MENPPKLNVNEKLPEPVIELILSKVPEQDIISCSLVCHAWRDVIGRKSLWKKRFRENYINWNDIPAHVRDKSWMVLHAHLRHEILSKNYIRNPSGEHEFDGWIFENGYGEDTWIIQQMPQACDPLPVSPFFSGNGEEFSFVPAYKWCPKYYWIDLWSEGLSTRLLKLMLPFQINCSQMYTTSSHHGGRFYWELRLLNSEEQIIARFNPNTVQVDHNLGWQTAQHSFKFRSEHVDLVMDLRYIVFMHGGGTDEKNKTHWRRDDDYFETRFARSCVTFECLEGEPEGDSGVECLHGTPQYGGRYLLARRMKLYGPGSSVEPHSNYDFDLDDDEENVFGFVSFYSEDSN